MSLVLGHSDAASRAGHLGADSLSDDATLDALSRVAAPGATEFSHLAPCRDCGAMNGLSASACWRCEADLSATDALLEVMSRVAAPEPAPAALDVSHLAPCRHCGAMNGVSAAACWQCECRLSAGVEALQPEDETPDTAPASDAASLADGASMMIPVLSSPAPEHYPQIARSVSSARVVRRRRLAVAVIALVSFLGASAVLAWRAWFADGPVPSLAAERAAGAVGFVATPVTDTSPSGQTAPAVPGSAAPVEAQAPRLSADPTDYRLGAAPQPRTKRPAATAVASAETQRGGARSASRGTGAAVITGQVTAPARLEAARPAAAATAECTATVAALGLCAAAPSPPKE